MVSAIANSIAIVFRTECFTVGISTLLQPPCSRDPAPPLLSAAQSTGKNESGDGDAVSKEEATNKSFNRQGRVRQFDAEKVGGQGKIDDA